MIQILFADGKHEVAASAEAVIMSDGKGAVITLSRAEFRETVIGWERMLEREATGE